MRLASVAIVVALAGVASCVLPAATVDDTTGSSRGGAGAGGTAGKGGASGAGGTGNRDAATAGSGGTTGLDAGNSDGDVGTDANEGGGSGGRADGGADVTSDVSDATAMDSRSDAISDADDATVADSAPDAIADASDATIADSAPDALSDGANDAAIVDSAPDTTDSPDAVIADSPPDAVVDAVDAVVADSAEDSVADAGDGAADGGAFSRWPDSPTAFCTNGSAAVACNTVTQGQDGTYAINTPSYSTVSGVVSDSVTQLAWQDVLSSTMDFAAASTYCGTQSTGGRTWRLPTFLELLSTSDYGTHDPATQVGQLSGLPYLWSSDSAFTTANAWVFQSASGSLQTLAKTQTFPRVRCVSGAPLTGGFVLQLDGTILDQRTNLIWGPDSGSMTWVNATSYCENASIGGFTNFRLPSLKELGTLIVPGTSPTYDPVFTDIPAGAYYASSTPNASMPSEYWVVQLDTGSFNPLWTISSQTSRVRCVR